MYRAFLSIVLATALSAAPSGPGKRPEKGKPEMAGSVPTSDEALAAKRDLWAEAALRQPGGPSYEFFERLLPPLRYVDAPFRHYPIVLSAPGALVKARLVSNGSALNALARQPNWRGEQGVPVTFQVGAAGERVGEDLRRLDGPKYAEGWLPVVQLRYRQGDAVYTEEAFAAVDPGPARAGVAFLRFALESGSAGKIVAQFEGTAPWVAREGRLLDAGGRALAVGDGNWQFNPSRNTLSAALRPGQAAVLAVAVEPAASGVPEKIDAAVYAAARQACEERWRALVAEGMEVETPERVVNNAWRSLIAGDYALLSGDEIRYSAGNQYAKLYIGEGGDALRSLLLWGHGTDARRMIVPLFEYTRAGLEFHQAAFKLQMLAHTYWVTRDRAFLQAQRRRWEKELEVILNGIEPSTGLLPREKYCGDIDTRVYSLNSNANCWRALRDMAAVLEETGDREWSARLAPRAAAFRQAILGALERSVRRDVDPPFVPIALFGEEEPYEPVTGTKMGSYWNVMTPYVLASGVYRYDSETATSLIRYLQEKGGLCMGLLRSRPNPTFWVDLNNVNDLYGLRYTMTLLQRDEPDRALVSFYGKLAQGMTRDTFISAEGSCLRPLDAFGRQLYLPPNSAGNAHFLWALRGLLVQDWDLDDDGRPETLRLLFATPRRWLQDGAILRVRRAPTAFGELSLELHSHLRRGEVAGTLDLPTRQPKKTLLRLRLPEGWRLVRVEAHGAALPLASTDTVDLTALTGHLTLRAQVGRR
jgi:hypothetical protein